MSMVNNDECEKAGIDQKVVAALARRIESVCRDADKLGITLFITFNQLKTLVFMPVFF